LALILGPAQIDDRTDIAGDRHVVYRQLPILIDADLGNLREVAGVTEVKRQAQPASAR
jgi:hypothetical protein